MKTEHVQTQIFSQILDSMLTARHSIVHLRDQFICIGDAADEDGSRRSVALHQPSIQDAVEEVPHRIEMDHKEDQQT
jgi:hypothetical protein